VQTFEVFSGMHLAAVATVAAVTTLAIAVRRRRPPDPLPTGPVEGAVGYAFMLFWAGGFLYLRLGPLYNPETTYPLQLCHWVSLSAAVVLVTAHPLLRAFVYFVGLGLCTQAVITPFLPDGPTRFPFWFFWIAHGMIVGVPIYDIAARGYRPSVRDYAFACAAAVFYVMFVLPIDLVTGWNYGFVGPSRPGVTSIVDLLGPWPQRLVFIVTLAAGIMFVLLLPWLWLARRARPITVRTSMSSAKNERSSARLR
jgi:hypothetical integral membrane protein (TIGR02206 family)